MAKRNALGSIYSAFRPYYYRSRRPAPLDILGLSKPSGSANDGRDVTFFRTVLIDGEQLATLMIRHNVGVQVNETLYLKKVDEDFLSR
jgi:hypothetical protein